MSMPIGFVKIDGIRCPCKSITYEAPPGVGGATCTMVLVDPNVDIQFNSHVQVFMGHKIAPDDPDEFRGESVRMILDSNLLASMERTIELDGDTLTIRSTDKMGTWNKTAPERVEIWPPNGRAKDSLEKLLDFVYKEKIGFSTLMTNLPKNIEIPRISFDYKTSYHETIQPLLAPFSPLFFQDGDRLMVYTLGLRIPGTLRTYRARDYESRQISKTVRDIINQVEIVYYPIGGDSSQGCSGSGSYYTSGCGSLNPQDLAGGNVAIEVDELRERLPEGEDGESGGYILTQKWLLRWRSNADDPAEITREVEIGSQVKQWASDGLFLGELVMEVTTINYFLGGTDFQISTGHQTETKGRVRLPGYVNFEGGDTAFLRLSKEKEQITFQHIIGGGPTDFRKVHSMKRLEGLVLYPDKVPLSIANTNETVEPQTTTTQWVDWKPISQTVEKTTPSGKSQVKITVTEFDLLRNGVKISTTRDNIGRADTQSGSPQPVSELIQDPDSMELYRPRPAITIDGTIRSNLTNGPDNSGGFTDLGREWLIQQAQRFFSLSGLPEVRDSVTFPRLLITLTRGCGVILFKRGGTGGSKRYLVEGINYTLEGLDTDGAKGTTTMAGLRLDDGGTV